MTITTTSDVAQATALWDDLRSHWNKFENVLEQIITTRAWEPLGYENFAEAWADKMSGTRLSTAVEAAQVVYALIDDGVTQERALAALGPTSGVGPVKFEALARQKAHGVPAGLATTYVRRHQRSAPSGPRRIHVELSESEYASLRAIADSHGLNLASEAASAVRAHFRRIDRGGRDG